MSGTVSPVAAALAAAAGEMAAGLAHEIRNPLASLYGSIQLLQGEVSLEGTQDRLMGIVLKESERLDALITDFLLFAFPHAGEKESIRTAGSMQTSTWRPSWKWGPFLKTSRVSSTRSRRGMDSFSPTWWKAKSRKSVITF